MRRLGHLEFDAAWQDGRHLLLDQVIAYAHSGVYFPAERSPSACPGLAMCAAGRP